MRIRARLSCLRRRLFNFVIPDINDLTKLPLAEIAEAQSIVIYELRSVRCMCLYLYDLGYI